MASGLPLAAIIDADYERSLGFDRDNGHLNKRAKLNVFVDSDGTEDTPFGRPVPMTSYRSSFIARTFRRLDRLLSVGFRFIKGSENANITIGQFDRYLSDAGSATVNSGGDPEKSNLLPTAFLRVKSQLRDQNSPEIFQGKWEHVVLHEIGHALGLEHPFDADDDDVYAEEFETSIDETKMAYGDSYNKWTYTTWYTDLDQQALVRLWGGQFKPKTWEPRYKNLAENIRVSEGGNRLHERAQRQLQGSDDADVIKTATGQQRKRAVHEFVNGGAGDDHLAAYGGDDMLRGGPGDDVLNGGDGIDVLDGGRGEDTLVGGLGNNSFLGCRDGSRDLIRIQRESHLHERGLDRVMGLDRIDRIILEGASSSDISFQWGGHSFIDGDFIKGWIVSVDEKPELVISDVDVRLAEQDLSRIIRGDG